MITLNNKHFAETEDEFIESLFTPGGTCVGYAKKTSRSIIIMDHKKNRIGIINKWGALCHARKVDTGYWYSFSTIKAIGEFPSYMKQSADISALTTKTSYKTNEPELWFK
jgi:hypothetical protein